MKKNNDGLNENMFVTLFNYFKVKYQLVIEYLQIGTNTRSDITM